MKRIFQITALLAIGALAACGGPSQSVTRGAAAPLGFGFSERGYDDGPSARSSVDLLSLG